MTNNLIQSVHDMTATLMDELSVDKDAAVDLLATEMALEDYGLGCSTTRQELFNRYHIILQAKRQFAAFGREPRVEQLLTLVEKTTGAFPAIKTEALY